MILPLSCQRENHGCAWILLLETGFLPFFKLSGHSGKAQEDAQDPQEGGDLEAHQPEEVAVEGLYPPPQLHPEAIDLLI